MLGNIHGFPKYLRLDNKPENISRQMRRWAEENNVKLLFIQPAKPAQNGFIERFNRSYREEVLVMYLFESIEQVQQLTDEWLDHYNNHRSHEALNNLTPNEFKVHNREFFYFRTVLKIEGLHYHLHCRNFTNMLRGIKITLNLLFTSTVAES